MENEEKSRPKESGYRLSTKQQAEIGDILLSARSVSRQLVNQAKQQSEEMLQNTKQQAAQIIAEAQTRAASVVDEAEKKAAVLVNEAEKKAVVLVSEAEKKAEAVIREAEGKAEAIVCEAEEKTGPIMSKAGERAASIIHDAEEHAAIILQEAERNAGTTTAPEQIQLPEDMQDYVVRCVGDCFTKLRQQQLSSIDLINKQWQAFLCNLTPEEIPPAAPAQSISREDIESRVDVIAKELLDMDENKK